MSIKTTKPVEDAAKLGGKLPEYYAAKNGLDDELTALSFHLPDGGGIEQRPSAGGTAVVANGSFGVVANDGSGFTRANVKDLRLFMSGVGNEGIITTGLSATDNRLTLCNAKGGASTNLEGTTYNTFMASNIQSSSERYKENIRKMTDEEADRILQFVSVAFDWKEDSGFSGPSYSFIAERLSEIDERFIYRNSGGEVEGILVNPILAAQNKVIKRHEERIANLSALLVEKGILTQEEIDGLEG
jgi:hypothetical protein